MSRLVAYRKESLGWDYNHWPDYEDYVTYQKILKEGMKVIESMLSKIHRSKEKE